MADPFSPSAGGGEDPDLYRNLMTFGLATMAGANQRDANGIPMSTLGAIGKGGLAAMEQGSQTVKDRTAMDYQRAQTGVAGAQKDLYGVDIAQKKFGMATQLQQINMMRRVQGLPDLDMSGNPVGQGAAAGGSGAGMASAPAAGNSERPTGSMPMPAQAGDAPAPMPQQVAQAPQGAPSGAPQAAAASASPGPLGIPIEVWQGKQAPDKAQSASMANYYDIAGQKDMAKAYREYAMKVEPGYELGANYQPRVQAGYVEGQSKIEGAKKWAGVGPDIATAWGKVGPEVSAAWQKPQTLGRPGEIVFDPRSGKPVYQAPIKEDYLDPATNRPTSQWTTPAMPGAQGQGAAPPAVGMPGDPYGLRRAADGAAPPSGAPPGPAGSAGATPGGIPGFGSHATGLSEVEKHAAGERGKTLEKQADAVEEAGNFAIQNNFLLDQLKAESKSWQPGKWAEVKGEAKGYLESFSKTFGIATPDLDKQLGDYQSFVKNGMELTRQATRATSSRAAFQEMQLIQKALPSPEMSAGGFNQIATQMQSVNDFAAAKSVAQTQWRQAHNTLEGFNTEFNSQVSPGAFLLHRLDEKSFAEVATKMKATPEGRAAFDRMMKGAQFIDQRGLTAH